MILPASYSNGFAPRDGSPLYPSLWKGCVGAWAPCLGPTGVTLRDWSGRANNGTLTGMDVGTDWVQTRGRYALDFDGSNDYVAYSKSIIPTGNATVSLWVVARSLVEAYFAVEWGSSLNNLYVGVFSNNWIARSGDGATGQSSLLSTPAVANTLTHLAVTRSDSTLTLCVNGIAMTSTSVSGFQGGNGNALWLCRIISGAYANCIIPEVSIYNRELSLNEIRLLASRIGIAYELAPRRRSSSAVAAFNRRRRLLLGASN